MFYGPMSGHPEVMFHDFFPSFSFRSLDICQDNDIERIHSLRLIRKILQIAPEKFPTSLLNVMISIANDGPQERDKTVKTCLATICELGELSFSNDWFCKIIWNVI